MPIKETKQNSSVQKEPTSLYLSSDLIEKLEDIEFYMKKQIPRDKRKRLNKSILHEIILTNVVENYLAEKQNSLLYKWIVDWTQV